MADSFEPDSFVEDSFSPDEEAPSQGVQGFFKSYKDKPKGLAQKADVGIAKSLNTAFDVVNAPFELVGEAGRKIVEVNNPGSFRAPSIVQTMFPSTKTEQPPENPFSLVNKVLRAGAGAVGGTVSGNPLESARGAYNAPRGTMGTLEDTAMGLLLGKVAPQVAAAPLDAVTVGAQKVASGAKSLSAGAAKKAIRVGLGTSEEATKAMFNRPKDLLNAKNEAALANDLQAGHVTVTKKINDIEKEVSKVLRTSNDVQAGATPKANILKVIDKSRKNIGMTVTNQEKYAKQILDDIYDNLNRMDNNVSEKQVRDVVQKLSDAASYGKKEYGTTDLALQSTRHGIDKFIKKNEAYKELMKKEAPLLQLRNDLVDNFGLKRSVGEGFVATDATASKLKTILGDTKEVKSQQILKRLTKETGQDYLKNVKDYKLSKEFLPGKRGEGSARTNLGSILGSAGGALTGAVTGGGGGAAIGGGAGAAVGGAIGRAADYYGGPMSKAIIDVLRMGKTGTGNVLSAVNAKTQGTPIQGIIKNLLEGQPVIGPTLRRITKGD